MTIQPVHTVYIPADRFNATSISQYGGAALSLLDRYGFAEPYPPAVEERVRAKLEREPVEDLRIDFEDGYGVRDDAEEDTHVEAAADALMAMAAPPRRWGLRIKSFADGHRERAIRTLDRFLARVGEHGELPEGFVVTFPKVTMYRYIQEFADILAGLEPRVGPLRFEIQVEVPQTLTFLAEPMDDRLTGAHFGVFDYTAALGLPPEEQRLDHPACDHARNVMQVALAGRGIELSDGSTNVRPVADSAEQVHAVWRLHARHVRHSLRHGFYQGWDLHPSHLVSRFATVYDFHLSRFAEYAARVRAWHEPGMAAGGVLDEPATVRSLLAQLRRAVQGGAVTPAEFENATGLSSETVP